MKRGALKKRQRSHFKRRLRERFGESMNEELYKSLVLKIQRGSKDIRCVGKQTHTRTKWKVDIEGKPAILVYSSSTKEIVTILYDR